MVVLGLIVLVLSGLLTADVALSNTHPLSATAFGVTLSNVSIGGLFLVGAVAGLVFGIGLALLLTGAARRRAARVGLKRQVKAVASEREGLAEENARLQQELERERAARAAGAAGTAAAPDAGPSDPAADSVSGQHARSGHGLFHR